MIPLDPPYIRYLFFILASQAAANLVDHEIFMASRIAANSSFI